MKIIKLYISLLICVLFFSVSNAQNGINYKAIVKDNLGNVVANQTIDVQFMILKGTAQTLVYQETHTPLSDDNGIIIVNIGEGTTADDFAALDWGDDTHFLNVQIDIGAGLVDMGTTEFKTVPYALYAESSGNSSTATGLEAIDEGNGTAWRLIGTDPNLWSTLGNGSVDMNTDMDPALLGLSELPEATIGDYSFQAGNTNFATGSTSVAMGQRNFASGISSIALGDYNTASGGVSIAMGTSSRATENQSVAIGSYLIADDLSSFVVGEFNDQTELDNVLFQVGNGVGINNRSNAFNVDANGVITAPSFDIAEITDDKALITKEYFEANGTSATGLEAIDEGNGLGWRLIDRDPANYGNIGSNAIDLSRSDIASNTFGATGSTSVAIGVQTEASGLYSFAAGINTIASEAQTIALGNGTEASGNQSTAMGLFTIASGDRSTAMGNATTASGQNSTTMGWRTEASAQNSTAIGNKTVADDDNGTVIGLYNDNTTSTTSLFQVGNGTDTANRSNAFNVDLNGTITAPSFDISEITDDKALITKEYLEANGTSATGLEAIDEGFGTGWRLIDRDPANYGNIGRSATDLSSSFEPSSSHGAIGSYSFAAGLNTIASGSDSAAFGFETEATAFQSTAMGNLTTASGSASTAMGNATTASAEASTAMGSSTIADDENGTVVGAYNDNTITTTSLFQVGNGTNNANRSNAFTIEANGTITAPSFDIAEITDDKALITKEYLEANGTSATGLEAIDEGNGLGWRLTGRDEAFYGTINIGAVDFSTSQQNTDTNGATGEYAFASGVNTLASGNRSTALGNFTTASSYAATAMGSGASASADGAVAIGLDNSAIAFGSVAFGFNTISDNEYATVFGAYNDNTISSSYLFQVGNGTFTTRSNAFNIDEDGTILAPSFDIAEITDPKALITKEYADANYAGGGSGASPTGLEAIDEGNGTGWRLIGKDPAYYGNIGANAIDFSINNLATSSTLGASGSNSFAAGIETLASGNGSVAMGFGTKATTNISTAIGALSEATGIYSLATGYDTNASGESSTAMGNATTASAENSTAIGLGTIADDINGTVVGKYNDNTATTTSLFQVGNGTSFSRSNALSILESGEHTINSTSTGLIINPGSDSSDDGVQVNNPGGTGIQILNSVGTGIQILNPGGSGISVLDASNSGVFARSLIFGGAFIGDTGGVFASTGNDTNPDIVLGGTTGSTATGDDGIISSDPNYSGSDIFLRSYDAVSVFLDYDNNETGQFEIKAGDGSEIFEVSETGNATLAGTLTQNSDRRLKKDITAINYGLNEILLLQPKIYNWKNRETEKKSLGLIAQEVQPIISEIVNAQDDEQKTLGISYTELIPVLIKAIQEQQAIIDNQKQVITSQEQTNTKQTEVLQALLDRVEALEKQSKISHIELAKN
ncbi:tail fiber domain-containing protein [Winogradskyella sp. A3E31]|uniref:tail fiber domain-containing protein n=1 Tax=Winogradskyella sp. A3E31 TaxID=3349637 RepID=UPI00398BAABF